MGKGKRKGPSSFFLNIWDRLTELCLILKRLSQGEERKEIELVSSERWKEDVKVGIWTHGSLVRSPRRPPQPNCHSFIFPLQLFSVGTRSAPPPRTHHRQPSSRSDFHLESRFARVEGRVPYELVECEAEDGKLGDAVLLSRGGRGVKCESFWQGWGLDSKEDGQPNQTDRIEKG